MYSKSFKYSLILIISLLPLFFVTKSIYYNCQNAIDYSIYQQAIYDISIFKSWNPYNTIRDIFIFNEHFDPIIYTAIPFTLLSGFSEYSLAFTEWFWYFCTIVFIFYVVKPKNLNHFIFLFFLTLFSRGILSGLLFSGHPVTWAIFPLTILVYSILKDNFKLVLISSLLLIIYKETFPFGILGLSFGYLFNHEKKRFSILFLISMIFILFEMKFRAVLMGETLSYGNKFLSQILENPLNSIIKLFSEFDYKSFVKIFFPFIIPLILLLKSEKQTFYKNRYFKVLCFILPLIAIHFIINRFYYHHASKFSVIFLSLFAFTDFEIYQRSKRIFYLVILLFFVNGMSMYTKMYKGLFLNKIGTCKKLDSLIHSETTQIKNIILKEDKTNIIFSTGGIIPRILLPDMNIYQKQFTPAKDFYDILVLETSGITNTFPLSYNQIHTIDKNCKAYVSKILFKSDYHIVLKGKFPGSCIYK